MVYPMTGDIYTFVVEVVVDDPDKHAILVDDGSNRVWIPRSTIHRLEYDHRPGKEKMASLGVPEWLAKSKGMI